MGNAWKTKTFICMLYCSVYWVTCELTIKFFYSILTMNKAHILDKVWNSQKHHKVSQKYPEVE